MEQDPPKGSQPAFGKAVKHLRKERGYSQNEFATVSGLTQAYLSRIERGIANPQLESIKKIAACPGIPLPELFAFDMNELPPKALPPEGKAQKLAAALCGVPSGIAAAVYDVLSEQLKRN